MDELHLLWRREMVVGSYRPKWVRVHCGERAIVGLAFTVKHDHPQYTGKLPHEEQARIIASAAPEPVAQSEIVKALTNAGYKATDLTKQAVVEGLDSVEEATGGSVVKLARDASKTAVYQMNTTVARAILKSLRR